MARKYSEEQRAANNVRSKAYRLANKVKVAASQHTWYIANRERLLVAAKDYRVINKAALAIARKPGDQRYYKLHKAEKAAQNKAWAKANPERQGMLLKRWAELNPDRNQENHRMWWAGHPGKRQAYDAKRRATEVHATPPWLTRAQFRQIEKFYIEARRLYELDGIPRHVDHIYPLQGKTCCGLHVPWNLQILTKTENLKKRNKLPVSPQGDNYVNQRSLFRDNAHWPDRKFVLYWRPTHWKSRIFGEKF